MHIEHQAYKIKKEYQDTQVREWRALVAACLPNVVEHAHENCVKGLRTLGITELQVPTLDDISSRLSEFRWCAVPVEGLLPPRVYLSLLAHRRFPIATNWRKPLQRTFSPEPDFFHEVFGHLCLLIDPSYRRFLERWGKASLFAFRCPGDELHYRSMRDRAHSLTWSENADIVSPLREASEATRMARLGWWSVECGLVDTSHGRKLFGAALLSSSEEAHRALNDAEIRKLDSACLEDAFDPTELQSHYYVVSSFEHLDELLSHSIESMAHHCGGVRGLQIAKESGEEAVLQFSNGTNVSGVITGFISDDGGCVTATLSTREIQPKEIHFSARELVSVLPAEGLASLAKVEEP